MCWQSRCVNPEPAEPRFFKKDDVLCQGMGVVFIVEKRHRTLVACIEALRRSPDRS